MDWYCIDYLYPRAFSRFRDVMFPNVGIISISTLEFYDIKKLYGFFDKEGIYLTTEMYGKDQWGCTISVAGIIIGLGDDSMRTREQIEGVGFMECFKLLDKRLYNI